MYDASVLSFLSGNIFIVVAHVLDDRPAVRSIMKEHNDCRPQAHRFDENAKLRRAESAKIPFFGFLTSLVMCLVDKDPSREHPRANCRRGR